jgi:hypothetical protein
MFDQERNGRVCSFGQIGHDYRELVRGPIGGWPVVASGLWYLVGRGDGGFHCCIT